MITPIPLLQSVRVASPCDASWEEMAAIEGERVKFCAGCRKNVYNLSAMSQAEAEGLLRRHEGRLCIRYYQRQDGTVLTGDCPVGAQAIRMALIRRSAVAAGLFALMFSAMAALNSSQLQLPAAIQTEAVIKSTTEEPEPISITVPSDPMKVLPTIPPCPPMQGMAVRWVKLKPKGNSVPPGSKVTIKTGEMAEPAIMGKIAMPVTATMGDSIPPAPKLTAEMGRMARPVIMGHVPRQEQPEGVIRTVPDQPHDYEKATSESAAPENSTSDKDATDEAILKPQK